MCKRERGELAVDAREREKVSGEVVDMQNRVRGEFVDA